MKTRSNLPVVGLLVSWSSVREEVPEKSIWQEIPHQTWHEKSATAQLHGTRTHRIIRQIIHKLRSYSVTVATESRD